MIRPTRSQGDTPVLGSEDIIFPRWKSGPLTPMQGLSPNSTAMTLLAGFAQGNVQMQGNTIMHLQEGNLARLQQVTIELLDPGTGRVVGSIPDVNFVEGMKQMSDGESIGEILNELVPQGSENDDQSNERGSDCGYNSMAREKQGKPSAVPSPATKAANKERKKEKQEKKDEGKDKLKPPLRSGLGPPALTTPLLMTMGPTTRPSPAKHDVMTSPEGAPLLKDPKIDKRTGVPKTSEAEKAQIRELLAGREKGKTAEAEESEETEEEETGKKTPPRRTSRDLE